MADLQAPIINWTVKKGDSKAGFSEQRVLLIAQGSGTNPAKQLIEDIQSNEVISLCGAGSMATRAYDRFRKYNKANEIDIITLAEPAGGSVAQGGFKITGDAQENKTLNLNIGDDEFDVSITVLNEDTAEEIATNVITAINAFDYPFTASIDGGDATLVLIDFDIKGEIANDLTITIKDRVLGCNFTVVSFTGGAGAYDVDDIVVGLTKRYQTVLFDKASSFDDIEEWLQSRINMSNTVKGGTGIIMMNGDLSTIKVFANTKNSQTMVVLGNCNEMKYNALPLLATAEFGAKRALRLTDGAVLGDLVIEAQESFGGINKSSLPYHNTPMSYDKPSNELILEQVQDLNDAGISLFVPTTTGVVLGALVTLYKLDDTDIEDSTFKYLNAMDTSLAVQEYLFVNSQKEFGQTRATGGDLIAGVAMTNELSVKAYIIGLYQDMVNMALVQGGFNALKSFKNNVTVELENGIYSVYAPVAIVSQFRGLNGVVAISYDFK